jgi:hypothetical protein
VLLILLEQDLIFQHDIENKVCPILLELSAPDSEDEYRAEAVSVSLYRGDCQHLLGLSHTLVSAGLEVSQTFNVPIDKIVREVHHAAQSLFWKCSSSEHIVLRRHGLKNHSDRGSWFRPLLGRMLDSLVDT